MERVDCFSDQEPFEPLMGPVAGPPKGVRTSVAGPSLHDRHVHMW